MQRLKGWIMRYLQDRWRIGRAGLYLVLFDAGYAPNVL